MIMDMNKIIRGRPSIAAKPRRGRFIVPIASAKRSEARFNPSALSPDVFVKVHNHIPMEG